MNKKKGYTNMAMREGEMTACILNEGALIYNKENDSISVESELRIDDTVELDMKTDNTYDPYNIPFVRKCTQSSTSCMGLIVSEPLWQSFPFESKTIQDWAELRSNRYYRFAVIYLLRPIAVVNNRYVLTSEILKELHGHINELHNKGINVDALRKVCLEYDLESHAFPESHYEGYSIYDFFLESINIKNKENENEWGERLMRLQEIKEKEEKE